MNSIILIGNICNDLELKTTNSGKSVVQFSLAVKRPYAKDVTDFIPVVVWNQTAEFLGKYAHKGSKVAIGGKLTTRKYEDKNGNNRIAYEVIADQAEICDSVKEPSAEPKASASASVAPQFYSSASASFEEVDTDEGLPF